MNSFVQDTRFPQSYLELCVKAATVRRTPPTSSPLPINAMTGNVIPWGERVFEDNLGALYYPESKPDTECLEYTLTVDAWLVHLGYWGGVTHE